MDQSFINRGARSRGDMGEKHECSTSSKGSTLLGLLGVGGFHALSPAVPDVQFVFFSSLCSLLRARASVTSCSLCKHHSIQYIYYPPLRPAPCPTSLPDLYLQLRLQPDRSKSTIMVPSNH